MFWLSSTWTCHKNKLCETSNYWSRNIDFLKKTLGLVSPPYFVHNFWREIFLMLYSINWPNFVVWLSLLLQISGNMCTVIVCYPVCNVINFEINLSFLIEPFSYMTKNSEKKLKYLKNEKGEIKSGNKKHFSSFLKDFQLSEIVSDLRVCL